MDLLAVKVIGKASKGEFVSMKQKKADYQLCF